MTHAHDGEPPPHILVVDDQPAICFMLQRILEHYGYVVLAATSQAEALLLVDRGAFDLLLVEPRLLGESVGRRLLEIAQIRQPGVRLALLAGASGAVMPPDPTVPDRLAKIDKTASPPAIATGVALALARPGQPLARRARP